MKQLIKTLTPLTPIMILIITFIFAPSPAIAGDTPFYLRGTFYQDWMGFKQEDSEMYNRLSSRLKLTLWQRPGDGWTGFVDVRSRTTLGEGGETQVIIYNAHIAFDSTNKKLFFSLGQMNLYDSAGTGQLTGALGGYKLNKNLSLGAYGGLEPDLYNSKWDTGYQKFGVFARYLGPMARQITFSYNRVHFEGDTEREYVYANMLFPIKRVAILYGNLEYELGGLTKSEDRLSRAFGNLRVNLGRLADVTAHYSSGRGLDYHRFLLEQSQDPNLQQNEVERYYYNESYGVRLSIKPVKNLRLFGERRESEQKDKTIRNHSSRFGLSASDILGSGFSLYGSYTVNRGDMSESDSFYISASKNFGKLSWNLSFSNVYNGLRLATQAAPEIIHLPDHYTLSTHLFYILNRSLAFSAQYAYSARSGDDMTGESATGDHQFYVRVIFRKR